MFTGVCLVRVRANALGKAHPRTGIDSFHSDGYGRLRAKKVGKNNLQITFPRSRRFGPHGKAQVLVLPERPRSAGEGGDGQRLGGAREKR